jgi:hypothetical protein
MAEGRDGRTTFDHFMENVNRLQADPHFREVLRELDEGRKETLSLLASDPAAFLRHRGVQIPQDFRVSLKKTSKDAAVGQGYIIRCDCIEVCFLRYCSILCYCEIDEFSEDEQRREIEKTPAHEASNRVDSPSLSFGAIETLVHQGKTVVSSEDSAMIEWVTKTIAEGRTATLYCKPTVFEAIIKSYWTPKHVEIAGLKPISLEQAARVKSDLNIKVDGYANSLDCPRCGHVYSTYEFIQQGIEEHGEEHVRAAFSLKGAAILQINPVQDIICRNCRLHIITSEPGGPGSYDYLYRIDLDEGYACCRIRDIEALAPNLRLRPD